MGFVNFLIPKREHAFLNPSSAKVWLGKDKDYLKRKLAAEEARFIGTKKHELAEWDIKLKMKRPDNNNSFNMYVNDAIGYMMDAEVKLEYSRWCWGTADALCFRDGVLRIHDLKTGETKTTMDQLIVYAALYCLIHDVNPADIAIELRIYQSGNVVVYCPSLDEMTHAMDYVESASKYLDQLLFLED